MATGQSFKYIARVLANVETPLILGDTAVLIFETFPRYRHLGDLVCAETSKVEQFRSVHVAHFQKAIRNPG